MRQYTQLQRLIGQWFLQEALSAPAAFPMMLGFSHNREEGLAHQKTTFPMSPMMFTTTKTIKILKIIPKPAGLVVMAYIFVCFYI